MYQKITLVGNLGRDPEMRYLPSGQAVTNLNVATNNVYTKDGQKVTETTWFRVSVWGNQAENANKYLKQGSKVLIEGQMKGDESGNPRSFTRNDGTIGTSFEVTANRVVYLSSRTEDQSGPGHEDLKDHDFGTPDEDDIPF